MPSGVQGLGVTAGLDPAVARDLAARCAELGYGSLWSNDDPTAPGLETLAHFAAGAPELDLGVGVLPLDRYPPTQIAAEIARRGLDPAKLWIGIGAGTVASVAAAGAGGGGRAARPPAVRRRASSSRRCAAR